jgi:hypothetical protein
MTLEDLALRLTNRGVVLKSTGRGYRTWCPVCEHRLPKLALSTGAEGRILVHCAARECEFNEICAALEIDPRALSSYRKKCLLPCNSSTLDSRGVANSASNCDVLLAEHAAARLDSIPVAVRLPKRAGRLARVVAEDFALVTGLRLRVGGRRAIPYAAGWAAERLGEDKRNVGRAIRWLHEHGVIERAGSLPPDVDRLRPALRLYRLSDLRREGDGPAVAGAVEAASSVAVVGRAQPLGEVADEAAVAEAELVVERQLRAPVGDAPPLRFSPAHVEGSPHRSNVIAHDQKATPLSGVCRQPYQQVPPRHSSTPANPSWRPA